MAELLSNAEESVSTFNPKDAEIRKLIFGVVSLLVDNEDDVEFLHVADDDGMALQVRPASGDVRRLIGHSGRTARAIRTILSGIAAKNGRRYRLDIRH